jgi:hypothetical protein
MAVQCFMTHWEDRNDAEQQLARAERGQDTFHLDWNLAAASQREHQRSTSAVSHYPFHWHCILDVVIDSQLTTKGQVWALCLSCFYQLHTMWNSLVVDAAMAVGNALVGRCLDYCNSLLVGVMSDLLSKLQLVQNAAARVNTRTRKFEHIPPDMCDLRWLPVCYGNEFKVAMLVWLSTSATMVIHHCTLPRTVC